MNQSNNQWSNQNLWADENWPNGLIGGFMIDRLTHWVTVFLIDWLEKWLIARWLIDLVIDWLIDWLIDVSTSSYDTNGRLIWLNDWLIDKLSAMTKQWQANSDWLIDWLMDWSFDCLNDWLIDRLWLIDQLIDNWINMVKGCLIVQSIKWLIDSLFDWSIDWLIDWSIDWLIDWLYFWPFASGFVHRLINRIESAANCFTGSEAVCKALTGASSITSARAIFDW